MAEGEWIIRLSEENNRLMGFDYAGTENGHDVIAIRFANYPTDLNGGTYIHQMGHQRGAGKGPQKLGTWKSTWNMGDEYISDKGTSEWYLERVPDEEAQTLRLKQWKRKGLLLNGEQVLRAMEPGEEMLRLSCARKKDGALTGDLADRRQMKMLEKYIFRWLGKMVDDIASGNVEPNPYTRGTGHDACTFCPYGAVCRKKDVEGRRNYKAMTAQRFWEEIEKEVDRHG